TDPRVLGLSQFLLVDSAPDTKVPPSNPAYWSTFQTGLEFQDGRPKPSFYAYQLPIWLPRGGTVAHGQSVTVWAMLRLARGRVPQRAEIQWSSAGRVFRTIGLVTTRNPSGILETSVQAPGSGMIRIAWTAPDGRPYYSRLVRVRVRP